MADPITLAVVGAGVLGSALSAWGQGKISRQQLEAEARRHGLDRQQLAFAIKQWEHERGVHEAQRAAVSPHLERLGGRLEGGASFDAPRTANPYDRGGSMFAPHHSGAMLAHSASGLQPQGPPGGGQPPGGTPFGGGGIPSPGGPPIGMPPWGSPGGRPTLPPVRGPGVPQPGGPPPGSAGPTGPAGPSGPFAPLGPGGPGGPAGPLPPSGFSPGGPQGSLEGLMRQIPPDVLRAIMSQSGGF